MDEVEFIKFIDHRDSLSKLEARFPEKAKSALKPVTPVSPELQIDEDLFQEIKSASTKKLLQPRDEAITPVKGEQKNDFTPIQQKLLSPSIAPLECSQLETKVDVADRMLAGTDVDIEENGVATVSSSSQEVARTNRINTPHKTAHLKVDMQMAHRLYKKIDKNNDGCVTLGELVFASRDNKSEEGVLLHKLLGHALSLSLARSLPLSRYLLFRMYAIILV